MLNNLKKYNILLASKSPRRKELLAMLDLKFKTLLLNGIDESYPESIPPFEVASFISNLKAEAYKKIIGKNDLVITADTIVICDDKILGKPKDLEDAKLMLQFLSNKTHKVSTGVSIFTKEKHVEFSCITEVTFSSLSKEEIEYYVEKYHPLDKAGAYGIQEWIGAVAIKRIDGSYYNVMGLPIHQLYQRLTEF